MSKLFFSYSHKDEVLRDELEIHLSMLKRQGLIETWHDRRIGAGKEFDKAISNNLEDADVILLLVSPYFLASDYCYDIEMKRALQKHVAGQTRVIPVILHPCDWHSAPFGKLVAMPRDGKPISKYPNQHDAFLEVVNAIKLAIQEISPRDSAQTPQFIGEPTSQINSSEKPRSSNLRIKKSYSEHDKDEFLEESFEYMANFFEGSLQELEHRNTPISTKFKRIDSNHFTAIIYMNGKVASECKIWLGGRQGFTGGIVYSSNTSSNDNSYNESMSLKEDGYSLFLSPMGMAMLGRRSSEKELLSQQGAAEYFWEILIQYLQ
jgi:TIR domain